MDCKGIIFLKNASDDYVMKKKTIYVLLFLLIA